MLGFAPHLRQPVVLRSSSDDWNLVLCSSRCETLLQPEWGMTMVLVSVVRASRMMVIFTASHDDRFHSTPVKGPDPYSSTVLILPISFL